jgi:hypothetical protein
MTTITTPAGDLIEVVPDTDFMEVFDVKRSDLSLWGPRQPILEALWHEGAVLDRKTGSAVADLHRRTQRYGYPSSQVAVSSILRSRVMGALIERDLNGKRTYRIQLMLLPESYVARLQATKLRAVKPNPKMVEFAESLNFGSLVGPPAQKPTKEAGPVADQPVPEAVPAPDVIEDAAAAVARELLAEVVRIVTQRPESVDARDLKERLANSLMYTDKLRKELRQTGDELAAVKAERDSLRKFLQIAETNLEKALGGDGRRFIDAEVQKRISRLMQAKPTTKDDDDG